jgi:DNA-binding NtrC family response regulator
VNASILVVDDDPGFRELVAEILLGAGASVLRASSGTEAVAHLREHTFDLVISDQRMPGLGGLDVLREAQKHPDPPAVILMTAFGTIPDAVEAMREGAVDYLSKPLESPAALRALVHRVLETRPREQPENNGDFVTGDPATRAVLELADRAAPTDATILITGPSGSGKDVVARRIHARSRRFDGPFVAVNCAAIPENLAESELFGHERGAFTGADRRREGRFAQADGGTLFLDEVGELSPAIQAKLLRALEDRTIEPVGGGRTIEVDLRLIAATNRSLQQSVAEGAFREDLYYRLKVVHCDLPPLSSRTGDIALLAPQLATALAARLGVAPKQLSDEALRTLEGHTWPGNVRELRNVLETALVLSAHPIIEVSDLPDLSTTSDKTSSTSEVAMSLHARERQAILEALEAAGGHRERAAAMLGISVRTLYNRLKQYDIR